MTDMPKDMGMILQERAIHEILSLYASDISRMIDTFITYPAFLNDEKTYNEFVEKMREIAEEALDDIKEKVKETLKEYEDKLVISFATKPMITLMPLILIAKTAFEHINEKERDFALVRLTSDIQNTEKIINGKVDITDIVRFFELKKRDKDYIR